MNLPTAIQYAKRGVPISRNSWADEYEVAPRRWVTFESGAWFDNTIGVKTLFQNGDLPTLDAGDYIAKDWVLGYDPPFAIAPQPDFPPTPFTNDVPSINVYEPSNR